VHHMTVVLNVGFDFRSCPHLLLSGFLGFESRECFPGSILFMRRTEGSEDKDTVIWRKGF
jgi:hypothetical protein